MPSLSTFFKKRRSLQTPPATNEDDSGDRPREGARLTYEPGGEAAATPRGAELEALARLADSSDEQAIAAPTVATGPRRYSTAPRTGTGTGRLNRYVSTHDPFRRFRSRSTQFRLNGGGDGDARTRLSWPAQRSTSESPDVAEPGRAQDQAQEQAPRRATDDWPMTDSVSAREASLAALERPPVPARAAGQDAVQEQQKRARADSEARVDKSLHSDSSTSFGTGSGGGGGGGNKLQKLKRLPSLSLKRGFSRRTSTVVSRGCARSMIQVPVYCVSSTSIT